MFDRKLIRKLIASALLAGSLILTSVGDAEIKMYEGAGKYIACDYDSIDVAKLRAKARAEQAAKDRAGVYLASYSREKNFRLTDDEIYTITNNIF